MLKFLWFFKVSLTFFKVFPDFFLKFSLTSFRVFPDFSKVQNSFSRCYMNLARLNTIFPNCYRTVSFIVHFLSKEAPPWLGPTGRKKLKTEEPRLAKISLFVKHFLWLNWKMGKTWEKNKKNEKITKKMKKNDSPQKNEKKWKNDTLDSLLLLDWGQYLMVIKFAK